MKHLKFLSFVLALILAFSAVSATAEVKIGDTAIVPKRDIVKVMNLEPVTYLGREFAPESTCCIEVGGLVEVIGIDKERLLVRYSAPGIAGSSMLCPSGVIFFLSKNEFSGMTEDFHRRQKAAEDDRALVERMLKEGK